MSSHLELEKPPGTQICAFNPSWPLTLLTHTPLSTVKQSEKKSIPSDEVKDAKVTLNRESHTERGRPCAVDVSK